MLIAPSVFTQTYFLLATLLLLLMPNPITSSRSGFISTGTIDILGQTGSGSSSGDSGAVLCITQYLAAFLTSTQQMPLADFPGVATQVCLQAMPNILQRGKTIHN